MVISPNNTTPLGMAMSSSTFPLDEGMSPNTILLYMVNISPHTIPRSMAISPITMTLNIVIVRFENEVA